MKILKKAIFLSSVWLFAYSLLYFPSIALATKDSIIYEYEIITQKKGEPFFNVLEKAGLNNIQKELIGDIPIYHTAISDRQLRFMYFVKGNIRFLKELRVARGNRMINFVLVLRNGKSVFIKKKSDILQSQLKKKIKLQKSTSKKTSPNALIRLESLAANKLLAMRFEQTKGQSLKNALQVVKLSPLQQNIIKTGSFIKRAKSTRQFTIYFAKKNKKLLLRGLSVARKKNKIDYIVKKINGSFRLVNIKRLNLKERNIAKEKLNNARIQILKPPAKQSIKNKQLTSKKRKSLPASKQKNSKNYKIISIKQNKGQTLFSVLKKANINSKHRKLLISMPARKYAQTTRNLYLLFEQKNNKKYLRALRIVRGKNVAEYVLVWHKEKWYWVNDKGQTKDNSFVRYPLNFSRVTSSFNLRRRHPITHRISPHRGIDLKAPHGAPIYAPADGVVTFSGRQRGYGITLEINHKNGYVTKYAHLSRIMRSARKGKKVKKGKLIAKVGNTGISTGTHLHYEIIVNGKYRNPATVRLPGKNLSSLSKTKFAISQYLPILRRLSPE